LTEAKEKAVLTLRTEQNEDDAMTDIIVTIPQTESTEYIEYTDFTDLHLFFHDKNLKTKNN